MKEIDNHLIDTGEQVFLKRNNTWFLGYFYKAYGGLNYSVHDLDSTPKEIQGIHIDRIDKLEDWKLIEFPQK